MTVCTGACLLPRVPNFEVLSGELYIPNTSAKASFVANVTVGSEGGMRPLRVRVPPAPSSLNLTRDCPERFRSRSVGAGGGHFFPRSPIDRARASWMLYSTPSLKSSPKSNRSFSGRLPGSGRASIGAYRLCARFEMFLDGFRCWNCSYLVLRRSTGRALR